MVNKLDNLRREDIVKIKDKQYEVVSCSVEADPAPDRDPPVRMYKVAYLHNIKSLSLMPTDELRFYEDNNEYVLFTNKSKLLRVDKLKLIDSKIKEIKINESEIAISQKSNNLQEVNK